MKIAITGSTGFIGSALVKYLSKHQSHELFPFDKTKHSLSSVESLKSFTADKDIVIHLAGIAKPEFSENSYKINALGTLNLLETVRLYGKPNAQFIFSSSFSVYAETPNKKALQEDNSSLSPRNHYGMSKKIAEELVTFYNKKYNIPTRILRISNPYGSSDKKGYRDVIQLFSDNIKQGKPITINGDGTQIRDFIFISDVLDAIYKTMSYAGSSLLINVCSGNETQLIELIKKIEIILGKKAIVKYNKDYSDIGYWVGSPVKALKMINFLAKTMLNDGLRQTLS